MNTELQKKWFVYLADHHEGPFDAAELSDKKSSGPISQQSYVWAEGMADWKPLVEVTELSTAMRKIKGSDYTDQEIKEDYYRDSPHISPNMMNAKFKNLAGKYANMKL